MNEGKKRVLEMLAKELEKGRPVIIVGVDHPDIPNLHNFYPKKYYETIVHRGFGFFEGRTEHGVFSFDAGGAMRSRHFDNGEWVSWSPLRAQNEQVLKDLEYDCEKVANAIREIINKE